MEQFLIENQWLTWLVVFSIFWTLPWKGIALWKAARNTQRWWFIALFVINTLAILEIVYIFFFSKKKVSQKTE